MSGDKLSPDEDIYEYTCVQGETKRASVFQAAESVGTLEGIRAFFSGLMAEKVGTRTIEDNANKIVREERQRSLQDKGELMRDETVVMDLLKVTYKGIKRNIMKGRIHMNRLYEDCERDQSGEENEI